MNIAAIKTFLAVTRTRNLNRAAEEQNITQSAVTARLDVLEQALGVKLLNRSRKGATLTKAGYAFLEQAEVIVNTWSNARARASLPHGVTRVFSFVCDPGLWALMGEAWIADIRARHSEIAVDIWTGLAPDASKWLQSGMSDAALLDEPLTSAELDHCQFAEEQLVQVATQPRKAVKWSPDYVFVDYGQTYRAQHAEAWPGDETATVNFSNPNWALAHLLEHGGSAYLPERLTEKYLQAGTLHKVDGATSFTRRVFLSWRKSSEADFAWLAKKQTMQER